MDRCTHGNHGTTKVISIIVASGHKMDETLYASTYVICKPMAHGKIVISKTVAGIKLISKHVSTASEYT